MGLQSQWSALWIERQAARQLKKMMGRGLMSNGWSAYLPQPTATLCDDAVTQLMV